MRAWVAAAPPEARAWLRGLCLRSLHQAETIAALNRDADAQVRALVETRRQLGRARCQIEDLVREQTTVRRIEIAALSAATTQGM